MNRRDGTTTFLLLDSRIGGQGKMTDPAQDNSELGNKQNTYTEDRDRGNNKYGHNRRRNGTRRATE